MAILLRKLVWKANNSWYTCLIIRDWLDQKEIEDYLDYLVDLGFLEKWGFLDWQVMDHKE